MPGRKACLVLEIEIKHHFMRIGNYRGHDLKKFALQIMSKPLKIFSGYITAMVLTSKTIKSNIFGMVTVLNTNGECTVNQSRIETGTGQ